MFVEFCVCAVISFNIDEEVGTDIYEVNEDELNKSVIWEFLLAIVGCYLIQELEQ